MSHPEETKKIIISGKGGAGIQYMAHIIANSAYKLGLYATLIKSYGSEARGGVSNAYIVLKETPPNPVIKVADIIVVFDEENLHSWKERAKILLFCKGKNNMFMLGRLAKELNLPIETVIEVMKSETSEKYSHMIEQNVKDILEGYK